MKTTPMIFSTVCWLICHACLGQVPDSGALCGEVGQPCCANLELCNVLANPLHVCVKNTCAVFQDELCGLPGGPCSPDFYTNVSFTQLGRFTPACGGSSPAGHGNESIKENTINTQSCPSDHLCEYNSNLNRFWPTCQPLPKDYGNSGQVCCPSSANSSAEASLTCSDKASYCIAFPSSPFRLNGHSYQRSRCIGKENCGALGEVCCPPRGAGVYFNPELPKRPFQNSNEANLLCERPYFCKTSTNMTIGQYSEGVCTRNIDPHCGLEEGSSCCIETRDGENLPYVGGTYRNLTYCTGTQPGSGNPLFCNETEFKCRAFPADQCGRPKGPCSPGFNSQPQFKTIGGLQSLVITEEICQNNSTCSEPGYYCNMDTNSRLPWATCLPQPKACGGAGQICCPQPSGALICTDNTTYCASPSGKYLMPEASLCIPLLPCGEAGQACCPARGSQMYFYPSPPPLPLSNISVGQALLCSNGHYCIETRSETTLARNYSCAADKVDCGLTAGSLCCTETWNVFDSQGSPRNNSFCRRPDLVCSRTRWPNYTCELV